jgi:hypothetical protein
MSSTEQSTDACPRCGEHRLALVDAPEVELTSYQVANATLGIQTDVRTESLPGIECLACGAAWPDLATFRAEQAG